MFRTIAQVLGVACSSAIIQDIIQRDLTRSITGPDAALIIDQIRHSTSIIRSLPAAERNAAIQAYDHALHVVFVINFVLSCLGVLGMMCIKEEEMPSQKVRGEEDDDDGDTGTGGVDQPSSGGTME